jgi:hypothetical protein
MAFDPFDPPSGIKLEPETIGMILRALEKIKPIFASVQDEDIRSFVDLADRLGWANVRTMLLSLTSKPLNSEGS